MNIEKNEIIGFISGVISYNKTFLGIPYPSKIKGK